MCDKEQLTTYISPDPDHNGLSQVPLIYVHFQICHTFFGPPQMKKKKKDWSCWASNIFFLDNSIIIFPLTKTVNSFTLPWPRKLKQVRSERLAKHILGDETIRANKVRKKPAPPLHIIWWLCTPFPVHSLESDSILGRVQSIRQKARCSNVIPKAETFETIMKESKEKSIRWPFPLFWGLSRITFILLPVIPSFRSCPPLASIFPGFLDFTQHGINEEFWNERFNNYNRLVFAPVACLDCLYW